MSDKKDYVYVLTHISTGKKYVGRSKNPKERCMTHMRALIGGYHNNEAMLSDYQKYGGDYKFEVVSEERDRTGRFNSDEKAWMLKLKTYDNRYGYNSQDPAIKRWLKQETKK